MQNKMLNKAGKLCLTLLSLTLLTQTVYGADNRVSYLDSVSGAYIQNGNNSSERSILSARSYDGGIETTLKLDSQQKIPNGERKINLSLRDSDIRQALRMLADKAQVNIAFDESVEGKITLDLNNITLNDAFSIIFKSSQLSYIMDGNTLIVAKHDALKDLAYTRKNMTVLPIKYVNAENVASFLNSNLFNSNIYGLSNKPIVTSNPRTNQIVIFGSSADVAAIKRVLPVLDTKPMINSYKVNHTTPKEMAALICSSLFYSGESSSSSGGSGGASGGAGGGAAASSSGGGSSEGGVGEIALGGGTVACRDQSKSSTGLSSGSGEGKGDSLAAFKSVPLTVTYFSDLGRISVYGGSVEQAEVIKEFIKEHDKKQLMAYIELSVIELNETGSKEFSNTWNLWTPFVSLGFSPDTGLSTSSHMFLWGNQAPAIVTTTETDASGKTSSSSTQTVIKRGTYHALTYQLQYLISTGNGRVLTNPKIMVTNGREATIDMTSDYIKSVTSQILQSSSTITSGVQRTYEIGDDEGLLIKIMPFISPEGYISMNISPEFATIKAREYTKGDSGDQEIAATLLQRRDLELKNIRVKDGETLVLAGLIKEGETQTVKKMPLLSDLPIVGVFFRGNSSSKTREELVIVVTPHIVKDDEAPSDNVYDL